MRPICYIPALCVLTALFATSAIAQKGHKTGSPSCVNPPVPTPGKLTQSTNLPNGDIMYYGHFLMYTPDGNNCAFSNRQLRLSLPRLQNDDPANPTNDSAPVILATIEAPLQGANDQMILYSTIRGVDSPASAFIRFDASAFNSNNAPTNAFYLNVTVIGRPRR